MPISQDRSVLFIHIPKCAGKSVEVALGIHTGADDEIARWRSWPNRLAILMQRLTSSKDAKRNLWGVVDVTLTAQHLTYSEIILLGLVERDELARMTKFAICRNPYDRAVSTFHHMGANYEKNPAGFEAFWREWPEEKSTDHAVISHRRNQWEFCVDLDGTNALDRIIRYESLQDEFAAFASSVLHRQVELDWIGRNRGPRSYREFYNDASKRIVRSRFAKDFEFFGYSQEL